MCAVYVIVKPPTKRATIETIKLLKELEFDSVFIDLPREFECYVSEYLKHKNFDLFIKQILEIMPSETFPISSIRGYEELLMALCSLSRGREVYCYGSVLKSKLEIEFAFLSAQLTLHDIITNKISIDRWLNILSTRTCDFEKWIREEAEYIATEASKYGKAVCITGYDGSFLKRQLSRYCKSQIKYTGLPFHLPPIEALTRRMSIKNVDQQEILNSIREHICFVKDFIIPYGLEDGLELWSRKKLYWLNRLS